MMYNDEYDVSNEVAEQQICSEMARSKGNIKYYSGMIWTTRKFRLINQIEMGLIGSVALAEITLCSTCFGPAFSHLSPVTHFVIGSGVLCLPPIMYLRMKALFREQKINRYQLSSFKECRQEDKEYYLELKKQLRQLQNMVQPDAGARVNELDSNLDREVHQKQKYKKY